MKRRNLKNLIVMNEICLMKFICFLVSIVIYDPFECNNSNQSCISGTLFFFKHFNNHCQTKFEENVKSKRDHLYEKENRTREKYEDEPWLYMEINLFDFVINNISVTGSCNRRRLTVARSTLNYKFPFVKQQ